MPGFTHLQSAQPVTFGHHLLAYVEMLARDAGRFRDARKRLNECPLGAAALAGTSFPIDREMTAKALGFDRPTANSLDSVADRDFALEALERGGDLRDASVALRRGDRAVDDAAVRLRAALATPSRPAPRSCRRSATPTRPSWCAARRAGSSARWSACSTVMKGLPLAYSKDMQEDKEGVFDALETLSLCLAAMTGMVADMTPDAKRMKAAAGAGYATATDLADWLVRTLKMPFREAHHVTGRIVGARRRARASRWRSCRSRRCRASSRASREDAFGGARRRALGEEPHLLRRHGAGQCAAAGEGLAEAARRRVNAKRSAASFACFSLLTGRKGRKARPSTRTRWRKNRVFTMAFETIRIRGQAK